MVYCLVLEKEMEHSVDMLNLINTLLFKHFHYVDSATQEAAELGTNLPTLSKMQSKNSLWVHSDVSAEEVFCVFCLCSTNWNRVDTSQDQLHSKYPLKPVKLDKKVNNTFILK